MKKAVAWGLVLLAIGFFLSKYSGYRAIANHCLSREDSFLRTVHIARDSTGFAECLKSHFKKYENRFRSLRQRLGSEKDFDGVYYYGGGNPYAETYRGSVQVYKGIVPPYYKQEMIFLRINELRKSSVDDNFVVFAVGGSLNSLLFSDWKYVYSKHGDLDLEICDGELYDSGSLGEIDVTIGEFSDFGECMIPLDKNWSLVHEWTHEPDA